MRHMLTPTRVIDYATNVRPLWVIDIETTGFEDDADIIEIGLCDYVSGWLWDSLVKPQRYPASKTESVTGISDDDVADAPDIESVLSWVNAIAPFDDCVFITHNGLNFDVPHINGALSRYTSLDGRITVSRVIDTYLLAKNIIPAERVVSYKLEYLAQLFGVAESQNHRAGDDCRINRDVFDCLVSATPASLYEVGSVEDVISVSSRDDGVPVADKWSSLLRTWERLDVLGDDDAVRRQRTRVQRLYLCELESRRHRVAQVKRK